MSLSPVRHGVVGPRPLPQQQQQLHQPKVLQTSKSFGFAGFETINDKVLREMKERANSEYYRHALRKKGQPGSNHER